jgi:hypothetical protein
MAKPTIESLSKELQEVRAEMEILKFQFAGHNHGTGSPLSIPEPLVEEKKEESTDV